MRHRGHVPLCVLSTPLPPLCGPRLAFLRLPQPRLEERLWLLLSQRSAEVVLALMSEMIISLQPSLRDIVVAQGGLTALAHCIKCLRDQPGVMA